ncbi:MAG: hypothetical protein H6730_17110 [Deltaproteobacteria bacterium]|nr:hypothetical protein [Deltaproteobacteria bacterium]
MVFDGTTTAAYAQQPTNTADGTQEGVLRIDLSDGSCEELFVGPKAGGAITAALAQSRSLLITNQARAVRGAGRRPREPLYGTLTSPWASWSNIGLDGPHLPGPRQRPVLRG